MAGRPQPSLLIVVLLLFLPLPFSLFLWDPIAIGRPTARLKRTAELPLRFRHDGVFKILQVTDMHYGNGEATRCKDVRAAEAAGCSDLNTTMFLWRVVREEKPDLIVFTGDNIFGPSATDAAESLFKAFSPVVQFGLRSWATMTTSPQ